MQGQDSLEIGQGQDGVGNGKGARNGVGIEQECEFECEFKCEIRVSEQGCGSATMPIRPEYVPFVQNTTTSSVQSARWIIRCATSSFQSARSSILAARGFEMLYY